MVTIDHIALYQLKEALIEPISQINAPPPKAPKAPQSSCAAVA